MGKYTDQVKEAIRRRTRQKISLAEAYRRVQTAYWDGEQYWEKRIAEYKESHPPPLSKKQQEHLGKLQDNKTSERLKRREAESLEKDGWDPNYE
jgi:hypothetical protein